MVADMAEETETEKPKKAAKTPMDRLRSKKRAVQRTVPIICDTEVADRYNDAVEALKKAEQRADARPKDVALRSAVEEAREAVEALEPEARAASEDFTFRGIGRKAFEDLVGEHPPTKAQRAEARKNNEEVSWNGETFPQALVAAGLVSPELSLEDIEEIWDSEEWNQAELLSLFSAALEVNTVRRTVELGKGSGVTLP